jgi:hypothetical protein
MWWQMNAPAVKGPFEPSRGELKEPSATASRPLHARQVPPTTPEDSV